MTTDYRQAHVIRIYQTNHDGSLNMDVWMDVLRLDHAKLDNRPGYQDTDHILSWQDGWDPVQRAQSGSQPTNPGQNQNTARTADTLMVQNPADSSTEISIDIIRKMKLQSTDGLRWQGINYVFANKDDNDRREVDVLTVYNTDVSDIDMSHGPVDWADYLPVLMAGTQDKTQSLSVEIPKRFALLFSGTDANLLQGEQHKSTDDPAESGPNTTRNFVFKNEDVENAITQTTS